MILLTFRDLSYRIVRFVVVTLLGAVVFSLLFVMTGLVEQFNQEPYLATEAMGASAWVLPEGVSGPFTATPSLPADSLAATDADRVAPVVVARSSLVDGSLSEEIVLIGHEPDGLGAPPVSNGRGVSGAGEAVVDDTVDVSIGDDVEVGGQTFTVVGRSSDTTILAGIPFVFVSTSEAQDLVFRSGDVISAVLVDGQVRSVPDGTVAIPVDDVARGHAQPARRRHCLGRLGPRPAVGRRRDDHRGGRLPVGPRTPTRLRGAEGGRRVEPGAARQPRRAGGARRACRALAAVIQMFLRRPSRSSCECRPCVLAGAGVRGRHGIGRRRCRHAKGRTIRSGARVRRGRSMTWPS